MKNKMPLREAEDLAKGIVSQLSPFCKRIEIAGSIRRRKPEVGDIELVAIPLASMDMFGEPVPMTADHTLHFPDWSWLGKVIKNGMKYKQIELPGGAALDLFIVTPPAQWGVQFMLRTGSAEFSHRLVTSRKQGGLMPSNFRVLEGAIWSSNHIIETPEERNVFDLIGVPYIEPENRN